LPSLDPIQVLQVGHGSQTSRDLAYCRFHPLFLSLQLLQPLLLEPFELLVVPIDHDILIVLIPEFPCESLVDRIIAELEGPLLHHLIDFCDHSDPSGAPRATLLVLQALQPDVIPGSLMLEARRVKVDVQHVALESCLTG
jgi:hypothetical protein